MITIEAKGNQQQPLVLVSSESIKEIYGTLTAIPLERLIDIYKSPKDETILVAEIKDEDDIRFLNVYLDCHEDAERLLSFIQHM